MSRPERHVFVCTQERPPGHPRGSCGARRSAEVYPEGVMYGGVGKDDVAVIIDEHLDGGTRVERLMVPADVWG